MSFLALKAIQLSTASRKKASFSACPLKPTTASLLPTFTDLFHIATFYMLYAFWLDQLICCVPLLLLCGFYKGYLFHMPCNEQTPFSLLLPRIHNLLQDSSQVVPIMETLSLSLYLLMLSSSLIILCISQV